MNIPLKMGIAGLVATSTLEAYSFNNISINNWNWIAVAVLTLLFFLLLISIVRDIKKNAKRINSTLIKNKCKNAANNSYIYDINNDRTINTHNLKNSIKNLEETHSSKNIEKLKENYKEIYLNNKEEEIFLKVTSNLENSKTSEFKLRELISHLREYNIVKQPGIITSNHNIVANEEIITDVFFLLSKHQTTEHSYSEPKFDIALNEDNNNLVIKIARELKLNRHINQVFLNNIEPTYSSLSKKYYGIYLYLIKRLVNKINAKLTINSNNSDSYEVSVTIPVDIRYEQIVNTKPNRVLSKAKKALIITDEESAYRLSEYLKSLNFKVDKKYTEKTNKEIPNFMDYDLAFVDSKLFEPILTEYLQTIKKYSPLKIIAILSENNRLYPSILVDETLDIDEIDNSLYGKIENLYHKDMVEQKEVSKNIISNKIKSKKQNLIKQGKVLIADDDTTNLHILEFMLKKYGILVTSCNNGEEVLNVLKDKTFDLIILDSVMPKLDGYQTIKKIRENEKYNSIPVVIHTSFSLKKSSMNNIFKLGFDSYLAKPFNKQDLKALIERYVPISKKDNKTDKVDKNSLKEFIAIYGESDKMLERYIKEKRESQALALIKDLQTISTKIEANDFIKSLNNIEKALKGSTSPDSLLIYSMSGKLKELKDNIMKSLSA